MTDYVKSTTGEDRRIMTQQATINTSIDVREQLYNDQLKGPIEEIQLPKESITSLHGIMIDLDPKLLVAGNPLFPPADDPEAFFAGIQPVLERHPLARHAEVRASGTGLQPIVWMDPPVELYTADDQDRWDHIVRLVQGTLPSDPNAPGITALTRAVGSINGKSGAPVRVLRPGVPVSPEAVIAFIDEVAEAPFKHVATILLGAKVVSPCPLCRQEGSKFGVLDQIGWCYANCSTVSLEGLFDIVFKPAESAKKARARKGGRDEAGAEEKEVVLVEG